jgi:hypothetical protein
MAKSEVSGGDVVAESELVDVDLMMEEVEEETVNAEDGWTQASMPMAADVKLNMQIFMMHGNYESIMMYPLASTSNDLSHTRCCCCSDIAIDDFEMPIRNGLSHLSRVERQRRPAGKRRRRDLLKK